jgi:hypothetical protein
MSEPLLCKLLSVLSGRGQPWLMVAAGGRLPLSLAAWVVSATHNTVPTTTCILGWMQPSQSTQAACERSAGTHGCRLRSAMLQHSIRARTRLALSHWRLLPDTIVIVRSIIPTLSDALSGHLCWLTVISKVELLDGGERGN